MKRKRKMEKQEERERQGEDTCPVCFSDYDHQAHSPYMLPCGHTFCVSCLLHPSLVRCGHLCCPLCRCLSWQPRILHSNLLWSNSTEQSSVNRQTLISEDDAGHFASNTSHGIGVSQPEQAQREINPVTISSNNRNQTQGGASIISQTRVWTNSRGTRGGEFSQRVRTFPSTEISQEGSTSRALHLSPVTPFTTSHSELQEFLSWPAGFRELDESLFFNRCALCYRQSFNYVHTLDCSHSLCQRCLEVLLDLAPPGWVSFLYCPQCQGQTAVFQQASDNTESSSAQRLDRGESAVAEPERAALESEGRGVGCCGGKAICGIM